MEEVNACFLLFSFSRWGPAQIVRRLLMFGIPGLDNPQIEPLFHGLLQRMRAIGSALETVQSAISSSSSLHVSSSTSCAGGVGAQGMGDEVREPAVGLSCTYVCASDKKRKVILSFVFL